MNNYKNKKILIFGLGLNQGGVGSAKFFAEHGAIVRVTDLKSEEALETSLEQLKEYKNISYTLGGHKNGDIDWANLIIKNQAVKPGNPYLEYAKKIGKAVETDMGIFLQSVNPKQIIGVTGTKGKSTTASLIYEVLRKTFGVKLTHTRGGLRTHRWRNVILAGNIGISVLETIPLIKKDTLIVLEISSFQLESFAANKVSPKWAVITNITPDHLNYYQSLDEYINAKKIIGKYQTSSDYLFLRKDDPVTSRPEFLSGLKAKIIYYSKNDLPENFYPKLLGSHNQDNIAAALAVSKTLALQGQALQALEAFAGVEFRLQLIYSRGGIRIYNDTAATSPEAGIKALETFPGCILICGGMNKKMDYTEFAKAVSENAKKVFFLEGDSTEEIIKKVQSLKCKVQIYGIYNNLEKLLMDVKKIAKSGDIILFSPAATSFNLFQNEFDRGRKFNKTVEKVFG